MHLISAIVAGVAGAENGFVDLVLRGTSTPATYYTDFEGTASATGTNIPLDARGGAIVFVNALVRVTVKSAGGATIREFVDGVAAPVVEVRSASFNGAAYSGGAVAPGNPTTLQAVLDKWITSAGSVDFKVLVSGAATNLSTAFSTLQGQRRYVVTEYGAVGDGVTNCLTAFNAAISAANAAGGGVVYVPPGIFALSGALSTFSTVALDGAGIGLSTLRMTTNATLINAGAGFVVRLSGFSMTYTTGTFACWLQWNAGAPVCLVENCDFQSVTDPAIAGFGMYSTNTVRFVRCIMRKSAGGSVVNIGNNSVVADVEMAECRMAVTGSAAGAFVGVGGPSVASVLAVRGCVLDASGCSAAATPIFLYVNTAGTASVVDTTVKPPPASVASWSAIYADGEVVESGNRLQSTVDGISNSYLAYIIGSGGAPKSKLFSRELLRTAGLNPNTATITVYPSQSGHIKVTTTAASGGTQSLVCGTNGTFCGDGAKCTVSVHNDTAGAITYGWGSGFRSPGTFAVAANSVRSFDLVYLHAHFLWYLTSDVAGAELAE